MSNFLAIVSILYKKTKQNELMIMANAMTYKTLLAIFPFLIFLMTLLGFLNIGIDDFVIEFSSSFPKEIRDIFSVFLLEVIYNKNLNLLSWSLLISVISSSFGFYSIITGLNKCFEIKETRSFIKVRLLSMLLVIIYASIMTLSLILFIFGDSIIKLFDKFDFFILYKIFSGFYLEVFTVVILFFMVSVIYKVAISKKISLRVTIPGTIFTICSWLIASKIFNIYVNNFSRYSKIYGSIGSIFILIFWINIFSFILLIGGQLNAILENKSKFLP